PEAVAVRAESEPELAVAPVKVAALTLEADPCTSRSRVADMEAEPVDDAELVEVLHSYAQALSLAPVEPVGPLVERGTRPVAMTAPVPEALRDVRGRGGEGTLVRARHVRPPPPPRPAVRLVRRVLAADELCKRVEQFGRQRHGRVDVVCVGDEREHALEISRAQCHLP